MYMARGSGLWYEAGRTLLCGDTQDLADMLNFTSYRSRVGDTKPPLFEAARRRLAGSFDSISFDSHIDGACCFRMVMHEIVSIASGSLGRCPVSDRMRRGWPPNNLRACACNSTHRYAGTVPPGRPCADDPATARAACEEWGGAARRNRTLAQQCENAEARNTCPGTCCRRTPWPLGEGAVRHTEPRWVESVC